MIVVSVRVWERRVYQPGRRADETGRGDRWELTASSRERETSGHRSGVILARFFARVSSIWVARITGTWDGSVAARPARKPPRPAQR